MKTNSIAAVFLLLVMSIGAFAQTPASPKPMPGPGVHKAKIVPAPNKVATLEQDRKAARKAELASMTPDERNAFKADRNAKKAAKLAAMTPEQRKQHETHKAERKAARQKPK